MSRIKRFLFCVLLALGPVSTAQADDELPRLFAGCAGRFSAELEHAWLMNRPVAENLAQQRAELLVLLDAVMNPDEARQWLSYRIETKIAQAALLTTSDFDTDESRAQASARLARQHLKSCERLLLNA